LGIERDVLKKYESGALLVDAKLLLSIGQILDAQPQYFFSLERLVDINLIDAPDIRAFPC
jgi:hypothetical protein